MKKRRIVIVVVIVLVALLSSIALSGCSDKLSFNKIAGFKKADVSMVEIISSHGAGKDMTDNINEMFLLLDSITFVDSSEGKTSSDINQNISFKINFYIKGYNGCYTLIFNNGFVASTDYNYKKSKVGFYKASNEEKIIADINNIFFNQKD